MANKTPLKFDTTLGIIRGFESGDTLGPTIGGTGLATVAANRILYATALDTWGTSSNLTFDGTDLKVGGTDVVLESRTLTAGVALSGGGDLSSNRTIDLDITELSEDTSPASDDFLVTYDSSATAHKKVQINNLPGAAGLDIIGLPSETAPVIGDYSPFYDNSVAGNRKATFEEIIKGALDTATSESIVSVSDEIIIKDASANAVRRVTVENLLANITAGDSIYRACHFT